MLSVGDIIDVNILRVEEGFATVEHNGVSATLMQVELTYKVGLIKVSDFLKVGDTVTVKVTEVDGDRFSVSLKEMEANPWLNPPQIGDEYKAVISSVTDYGYFLEIQWFCFGLLLSENAKSKHCLGDEVTVIVTESNPNKKMVFLNEL